MLQQSYGKYIRDDGDALLRSYVTTSLALPSLKEQETGANRDETETCLDGTLIMREAWWSQRESNPCYRRERPVS